MNRNRSNDDGERSSVAEIDRSEREGTAREDPVAGTVPEVKSTDGLQYARSEARVPPVRMRRWVPLMVTGSVLAVVAWLIDQGLTNRLIAENVQSWIDFTLWLPVAITGYCVMLAILAAFPNGRRLMAGFLAAVLLSGLVTHVLKFLVGRGRPDLGLGPLVFHPLSLQGEYQSFPSGHASAAATLALLLGIYFPKARWVFYFYAACIGFDRIVHNRHYTSDVLAGYVIGGLCVYICVRLLGAAYYQKDLPATAPDQRAA